MKSWKFVKHSNALDATAGAYDILTDGKQFAVGYDAARLCYHERPSYVVQYFPTLEEAELYAENELS